MATKKTIKMPRFTFKEFMSWDPCWNGHYDDELATLNELWGRKRWSAIDIAQLEDIGRRAWSNMTEDKWWAMCHMLPRKVANELIKDLLALLPGHRLEFWPKDCAKGNKGGGGFWARSGDAGTAIEFLLSMADGTHPTLRLL